MSGKKFKALVIVELLILYFAVLVVISCWRGPNRYGFDQNDDLLTQTELTLLSDPDGVSNIQEGKVYAHNPSGGVFVVGAQISLRDIDLIRVRFQLECPDGCAGREIHVDLMGEDYDSDEQESVYCLVRGSQEFTCDLPVGDQAPDQAVFRVFCLEPVEFELSGLSLLPGRAVPKVQTGHWAALAAAAALLAITLIIGYAMRRKTAGKQDDIGSGPEE